MSKDKVKDFFRKLGQDIDGANIAYNQYPVWMNNLDNEEKRVINKLLKGRPVALVEKATGEHGGP